ncbi:MAG: ice-binding family protein [Kiritimatiellia bacterium]
MKPKNALALTLLATAMLATAARGGYPELPLDLGSAGDFVVLAKSGIGAGASANIVGDIGVSPIDSTAITGFALGLEPGGSGQFTISAQVIGKVYAADYSPPTPTKMTTAVNDMEAAYTAAAGRILPNLDLGAGHLGGLTLVPGLYKWGTGVDIATDVTLSGGPNDVWIFQIEGTLNLASAKNIILSGGAQSKNIFWQVADAVTIFTTAHFEGNILAKTAITVQTGASCNGRLLAQTRVDFQANATITAVPPTANLSLTKSVDQATPILGSNVVFTIAVTNAGPDAATGVTVQDLLPAGLTYLTNNPGLYTASNGIWNIGNLAVGSSTTLTITATVNTSVLVTNIAQVWTADQFDPSSTPGNNNEAEDDQGYALVNVGTAADLSLTKTVDTAAPALGSNITFTITVTNSGPNAATGVTVKDVLPVGLGYVTNSAGVYTASNGIWTIGNLTVGGSTTLTITATATMAGVLIVNTAQVWTADQMDPDSTPGNNKPNEDDQATVNVNAGGLANLSLTQTASNMTPVLGTNVTFTITVTNAGPNTATGVTVKDLLSAGLLFVTNNAGVYTASNGIWNIGTLTVGASTTLVITVTVTNAGVGLAGLAQVWTADQVDPNSTPGNSNPAEDDQRTVVLSAPSASDLALTMSVDHTAPLFGSNVVFTITVTNAGPNTTTNVTVKDLLPAGLGYVTNSAGVYAASNGFWTIGAMNVGASTTLLITATVTDAGLIITNVAQVWTSASFDPDSTAGNSNPNEDDQGQVVLTVAAFVDMTSHVAWSVTWAFNPTNGMYAGAFTITNTSTKWLLAPLWFEVQSNQWHWLHAPSGVDINNGNYYVDLSSQFSNRVSLVGNYDYVLNPGEAVTLTNILLQGRRSATGMVMAVWVDPALLSPTSPSVHPPFTIWLGSGGTNVVWNGLERWLYAVECSTNLQLGEAGFQSVATGVQGQGYGTLNAYAPTNRSIGGGSSSGAVFYRVKAVGKQ